MTTTISPEQFGHSQKAASLAAQRAFAWWCWFHPAATKEAALASLFAQIDRYGTAAARLACVYHMTQRQKQGFDDGWQILPSTGESPETLHRWIERHYKPTEPLRGLRPVIDRAVKAYGRRTLARRRGYVH